MQTAPGTLAQLNYFTRTDTLVEQHARVKRPGGSDRTFDHRCSPACIHGSQCSVGSHPDRPPTRQTMKEMQDEVEEMMVEQGTQVK